jgi:uncharacterized OB-fold protein
MNGDGQKGTAKLPPAELIALSPDEWTEPFWAAAREHRLVVPRCTSCGTYRFPPSPFCYVCRHQDIELVEQTGHGTVYSYTIAWHPLLPDVSDSVPYIPVVVELPNTGGVRVIGNLIDVTPADVTIGMKVELVWRDIDEMVSVPTFRPI